MKKVKRSGEVSHFLHFRLSEPRGTFSVCTCTVVRDSSIYSVSKCIAYMCVDVNGVCDAFLHIYNVSKSTSFVCLCDFNESVFVCLHMPLLNLLCFSAAVYLCMCFNKCQCVLCYLACGRCAWKCVLHFGHVSLLVYICIHISASVYAASIWTVCTVTVCVSMCDFLELFLCLSLCVTCVVAPCLFVRATVWLKHLQCVFSPH